MECTHAIKELQRRIERASSPYDRDVFERELQQLLKQLDACCDGRGQQLGQILVDRALSKITTAEAVELLSNHSIVGPRDQLAMRALNDAARFSLKLPGKSHREFRGEALAIAEALRDVKAQCIILTNWAFAALAEGALDEAELQVNRALPLVDELFEVEDGQDKALETRARLLSHRAKIRFRRARAAADASLDSLVASAIGDYGAAIDLVRTQVHWRVNLQIELADELTLLRHRSLERAAA